MNIRQLMPLYTACWLITGCGGSAAETTPPPSPPPPPPPPQSGVEQLKARFSSWLPIQQQWLQGVSCPESGCATRTVRFSEGRFEPQYLNTDQTILVLDTDGMDFLATQSYRHRIKSYWHYGSQGQLEPRDAAVRVPDFIPELYQRLRQFHQSGSEHGFVPAQWLSPLQTEVQRLARGFTQPYAGHGSVALSYLAEHNPQAELVVVQLPDFSALFQDEFCRVDITALTAKISAFSEQFYQTLILGQDVEWLNMSAGYELSGIRFAAQRCAIAPPESKYADLLQAYQPFYQILFNSPKLLAVQAGVVNNDPNRFPLDQAVLPHRIRAGVYNTRLTPSGLNAQGVPAGALPALPADQQNSLAVLDTLINFAYDPDSFPCQVQTSTYRIPASSGLGYGALCDEQTSWAAPAVLSRLIHLRQSQFAAAAWSDQLIGQLQQALTPSLCTAAGNASPVACKLQDPLLHRQHEVFRLQYLP